MSPFAAPFAVHVSKRCRCCRLVIRVTLLNGATEPRDGFYTCAWCLAEQPTVTDELLEREQRPQLHLVEDDDRG